MSDINAEVRRLSEALIYELTKALALSQTGFGKKIIRMLLAKPARMFAELGAGLDRKVAEGGVAAAARWALPRFVKSQSVRGVELLPPEGPLVIAANHPAAVDSLVISAQVERPDYKIIIGDIPFFENMPHVSRYAFYAPVKEDIHGRMKVIRDSIRHLQGGGALLIFPRGGIEADPEFMPNPDGEFDLWSHSLEIFLKHVPQTKILVTIVSGVISKRIMNHPVTRLRKARGDRQRLAFVYQFLRQTMTGRELFGLTPRVTFGEVVEGSTNAHVLAEVGAAARRTLEKHMSWAPSSLPAEA